MEDDQIDQDYDFSEDHSQVILESSDLPQPIQPKRLTSTQTRQKPMFAVGIRPETKHI
jgi:hypothetical protein